MAGSRASDYMEVPDGATAAIEPDAQLVDSDVDPQCAALVYSVTRLLKAPGVARIMLQTVLTQPGTRQYARELLGIDEYEQYTNFEDFDAGTQSDHPAAYPETRLLSLERAAVVCNTAQSSAASRECERIVLALSYQAGACYASIGHGALTPQGSIPAKKAGTVSLENRSKCAFGLAVITIQLLRLEDSCLHWQSLHAPPAASGGTGDSEPCRCITRSIVVQQGGQSKNEILRARIYAAKQADALTAGQCAAAVGAGQDVLRQTQCLMLQLRACCIGKPIPKQGAAQMAHAHDLLRLISPQELVPYRKLLASSLASNGAVGLVKRFDSDRMQALSGKGVFARQQKARERMEAAAAARVRADSAPPSPASVTPPLHPGDVAPVIGEQSPDHFEGHASDSSQQSCRSSVSEASDDDDDHPGSINHLLDEEATSGGGGGGGQRRASGGQAGEYQEEPARMDVALAVHVLSLARTASYILCLAHSSPEFRCLLVELGQAIDKDNISVCDASVSLTLGNILGHQRTEQPTRSGGASLSGSSGSVAPGFGQAGGASAASYATSAAETAASYAAPSSSSSRSCAYMLDTEIRTACYQPAASSSSSSSSATGGPGRGLSPGTRLVLSAARLSRVLVSLARRQAILHDHDEAGGGANGRANLDRGGGEGVQVQVDEGEDGGDDDDDEALEYDAYSPRSAPWERPDDSEVWIQAGLRHGALHLAADEHFLVKDSSPHSELLFDRPLGRDTLVMRCCHTILDKAKTLLCPGSSSGGDGKARCHPADVRGRPPSSIAVSVLGASLSACSGSVVRWKLGVDDEPFRLAQDPGNMYACQTHGYLLALAARTGLAPTPVVQAGGRASLAELESATREAVLDDTAWDQQVSRKIARHYVASSRIMAQIAVQLGCNLVPCHPIDNEEGSVLLAVERSRDEVYQLVAACASAQLAVIPSRSEAELDRWILPERPQLQPAGVRGAPLPALCPMEKTGMHDNVVTFPSPVDIAVSTVQGILRAGRYLVKQGVPISPGSAFLRNWESASVPRPWPTAGRLAPGSLTDSLFLFGATQTGQSNSAAGFGLSPKRQAACAAGCFKLWASVVHGAGSACHRLARGCNQLRDLLSPENETDKPPLSVLELCRVVGPTDCDREGLQVLRVVCGHANEQIVGFSGGLGALLGTNNATIHGAQALLSCVQAPGQLRGQPSARLTQEEMSTDGADGAGERGLVLGGGDGEEMGGVGPTEAVPARGSAGSSPSSGAGSGAKEDGQERLGRKRGRSSDGTDLQTGRAGSAPSSEASEDDGSDSERLGGYLGGAKAGKRRRATDGAGYIDA